MSRLARRPSRPKPPIRGRAAAVPPLGQTVNSLPVVRQRPSVSSHRNRCEHIDKDCLMLCRRCPRLFKILNRPWKWLVVIFLLMALSFLIGTLV